MNQAASPVVDLDALTLGHGLRLEDLVDRKGLAELTRSIFGLFGVPIRFFSNEGTLLADSAPEQELCRHLNTLPLGRTACVNTIDRVKRVEPVSGEIAHPCFSGATYLIVPIEYDHRRLGRVILGPYVSTKAGAAPPPPESLLGVDPALDGSTARTLHERLPRVEEGRVKELSAHIQRTLDLILFAGHKALLTSHMHLASVTASYHELADKNTELTEAVNRLRELDRLKSNFLATVSHELRTPLTSIIGYSEMLTEGIAGEMQGEQREFVVTIREKGEQLLSLIMNLLDLSKMESGTMTLKRTEVHIAKVLTQVVSTLLPTARKKGVHLEWLARNELSAVMGDAEKLRQVFLNLTENALKFTPEGGSVRLVAEQVIATDGEDDDAGFVLIAPTSLEIRVRVEDSGIGIPPGERVKVFDPFYQVDSSSTREYGGTGLGLSIVKKLVEAHQGRIAVEANAPNGTVFVVSLPLPR